MQTLICGENSVLNCQKLRGHLYASAWLKGRNLLITVFVRYHPRIVVDLWLFPLSALGHIYEGAHVVLLHSEHGKLPVLSRLIIEISPLVSVSVGLHNCQS